MHKRYIFVLILNILVFCLLNSQYSYALGSGIIISQVQTRSLNGGSASEELIEIYNNSDNDIDITDWCVKYGSTGTTTPTKSLTCFKHTIPTLGNYVYIPGRSSSLLISKTFADLYPSFGHDLVFSSGISDSERWVSITDKNGLVVDIVEWGTVGTSTTAEGGIAAVAPTLAQLIQRKLLKPGELIETNNNFNDFELAPPRTVYSYGSLYEIEDACLNIDSIQLSPPAGYKADISRTCTIPQVDFCPNIVGVQSTIPDGYFIDAKNNCMLDLLPLKITELLPDVIGIDEGSEFIEIYNPNDTDVDLANYVLYVGENETGFNFSEGTIIKSGQYQVFLNSDIKFTLVNTTSNVSLKSTDGQIIDSVPVYNNPEEGYSWALIDDIWQYTNRPTPGLANLIGLVEETITKEVVTETILTPCATNQYRSLETNRCRLIVTSASSLTPCKDGQYRSEETNRCRSIASDAGALEACDIGQERNPETNRCRSVTAVLGVNDLTPCKVGQERNPDTNRCRNVTSAIPTADYAPEQTAESSNNYILWWSLAAVGLIAIGYGIWEWRKEILNIFNTTKKFTRKKDY